MQFKNLLVSKEENITVLTVNRPQVMNALNDETISELKKAFQQLEEDGNIRVIILTGAGEKAFIAGADINELKALDTEEKGEIKALKGQNLFYFIEDSTKIVIAAVNGFALGGGCEIALSCDIRIASDNAKFGQPEVNLGIIPGYGGTQRLPRLVGKGKAMEMILTGDMIDASEAFRIGLVEKVVTPAELLKACKEIATKISSKAPLAIKAAKRCINYGVDANMKLGTDMEAREFGKLMVSQDKEEGMSAFLGKRKAVFKGR